MNGNFSAKVPVVVVAVVVAVLARVILRSKIAQVFCEANDQRKATTCMAASYLNDKQQTHRLHFFFRSIPARGLKFSTNQPEVATPTLPHYKRVLGSGPRRGSRYVRRQTTKLRQQAKTRAGV